MDAVIVTNGNIKDELLSSGRSFDTGKSFHEREQNFKVIFNKLASRQLFEEIQETQQTIDYYTDVIIGSIRSFPPYVNEIFKIYPHDEASLLAVEPSLTSDLADVDKKIAEKETQVINSTNTDETKMMIRSDIRKLQDQREALRWNAYIKLLAQKDESLASAMQTLVDNKFDFSKLNITGQQVLINVLVKNKLEDLIKNKAPDLLSADEDDMRQFVEDLFDLQKMDVSIPTNEGSINIKFTKKEFISEEMENLLSIDALGQLENLPLQFEAVMTPSSEAFFEESVIFHSLFSEFKAKNRRQKLNESYKVSLKKDGKTVE